MGWQDLGQGASWLVDAKGGEGLADGFVDFSVELGGGLLRCRRVSGAKRGCRSSRFGGRRCRRQSGDG